jgi:hypothetical protein
MAKEPAARWGFITDPLAGKVTLSRVIWLYGIVGSLIYSAFGALVDVTNVTAFRLYTIGGLIYTVYVTIATYRCAVSMKSPFWRLLVRVSAVLTLLLLPLLGYLAFSGALMTMTNLEGVE